MNRQDLERLQTATGYPMVSLLARTHRRPPENAKDPITVKNLITEVESRLGEELKKREVWAVVDELRAMVDEIDWAHTLDGLALFVGGGHAEVHHLPFPVSSRVAVDTSFATRDLVDAMLRSGRYRVLVLSEKPTRLYEGYRDDLDEVVGQGFPTSHDPSGGTGLRPLGRGMEADKLKAEFHRQFFREIHAALGVIHKADPLPLVVVGVDRYLAYWDEVTGNTYKIIARITGSHDRTPAHEIAAMAWPLVQAHTRDEEAAVLGRLEVAQNAGKLASGLAQAWRAAHEARGALLVVERTYHQPGTVDDSGLAIQVTDDAAAPGVVDDLVDELIEQVFATGGDVVLVDEGLAAHDRVALVLRY